MFNLGFSELLLLGAIALIFIGPKQLPEMARVLGRMLNELKRASSEFQRSFTEPFKDDLANRLDEARKKNAEPKAPPPPAPGPTIVTEPEEEEFKRPRGDGHHES